MKFCVTKPFRKVTQHCFFERIEKHCKTTKLNLNKLPDTRNNNMHSQKCNSTKQKKHYFVVFRRTHC